ncbi:MAG: pyruvate formate lyase family protein, partial [Tannerellaceae bacterium]
MNFNEGRWMEAIDVTDFVKKNVTPYDGDASFLAGPTERTKKVWALCCEAIKEERENNGVREIDNKLISTITSHKAGYIDQESELIVGLQTDKLLRRAMKPYGG